MIKCNECGDKLSKDINGYMRGSVLWASHAGVLEDIRIICGGSCMGGFKKVKKRFAAANPGCEIRGMMLGADATVEEVKDGLRSKLSWEIARGR